MTGFFFLILINKKVTAIKNMLNVFFFLIIFVYIRK